MDPGSPFDKGFMEPQYLGVLVIVHPNHQLTFGEPGSLGNMCFLLFPSMGSWEESCINETPEKKKHVMCQSLAFESKIWKSEPPKINMEPQKEPFQKGSSLPTIIFAGLLLVF